MNAPWIFVLGAIASVGLAALTVAVLRPSLSSVLEELCGSATRARFWLVLTASSTLLVTMFGVLLALPPEAAWEERAWRDMLVGLRAGMFGLLLCLAGVAFVLLLRIHDRERTLQRRDPPSWMRPAPDAPGS